MKSINYEVVFDILEKDSYTGKKYHKNMSIEFKNISNINETIKKYIENNKIGTYPDGMSSYFHYQIIKPKYYIKTTIEKVIL